MIDSLIIYSFRGISIILLALISTLPLFGGHNNIVFGSHITGTQSDDALTGGVGHLIRCLGNGLTPSICVGTNHNDKIIGINGPETIYGFDGNDLINGFSDADVIYGGDGMT